MDATSHLAAALSPLLKAGDFVALEGSLGTGKTAFARALLRSLGVKDDIPSPTFTLLQTYETDLFHLNHFDLYRLKSPDELDELGWDDLFSDSVRVVEWPERAGPRLPESRLRLYFEIGQDPALRHCIVSPFGNWVERLGSMS